MTFDMIKPQSELINDELKAQLTDVFSRLTRDVEIVSVIDPDNDKCVELGCFLAVAESLSPRLTLTMYAKGEKPDVDALIKADRLPVAALYVDGEYTGVSFHGVPGGKEINSFVLGIYNVGSKGQPLTDDQVKRIGKIKKPKNVKVFVSLSCHYCAAVVVAAQHIAALNPNVEAEMYDAQLYPDIIEKYNISRIPVILINDKTTYVGKKDMDELIDIIKG